MSRIRGKDTGLELQVRSALHQRGLRFRKHVKGLPGTPDVVFPREKIAIFIDGDFWHGYRYTTWRDSLSEFWQAKIENNRRRDRRNFAKLRRLGWHVIRIWGHQLKSDSASVIDRIERAVLDARVAIFEIGGQ